MRAVFCVLVCSLLLAGLPVYADSQRPVVVASVPVLGLVLRELAADDVDVHVVLAGNSSPHDYTMKFSDRKALASAARVYWVGPGLEAFLVPVLQSSSQSVALFPQLPESRAHVWFSPKQMHDVTQRMATDLAQLIPGKAEVIAARAAHLQQQIDVAAGELKARLQPVRGIQLIAGHDAYAALAEEFQLRPVQPVLQQIQSSVSAQRMASLDKLATQGGGFCVIEERNHPVAASRALAARHRIPLVELDVYGAFAASYPAWLQYLGDTLQHCIPAAAAGQK